MVLTLMIIILYTLANLWVQYTLYMHVVNRMTRKEYICNHLQD